MKRPDQTTAYLAVSLGSVVLMLGSCALSGAARAGSTVEVDARSSAPIATVGTPRAATASVSVSPLVATVGSGPLLPTVATTPTVPNLGNAGLAADFDGSQRTMPYELYSAIVANFPQSRVAEAIAVAKCETGATWRRDLVSRDGAQGAFQVLARFHGPVPTDYAGQARQAAAIVAVDGWEPWSCKP